MFLSASWYPFISFLFIIPVPVDGHSHTLRSSRYQWPSLVNDLKIAWSGLLSYPSTDLLLSRDVVNATTSPQSGNFRCQVNIDLSPLGPPVRSSSGSTNDTSIPTTGVNPSSQSLPPSIWKIQKNHSGASFFDEWTFWTDSDPTHGTVEFVNENTARSANLSYVNHAGNVIMAVDTTQVVTGNRRSIRITTNYQFTGGLLVLDVLHAPTGCGTWPAFWSNGPDWPNNGEIDIMEGVNDVSVNQASIHTAPGCNVSPVELANNASGTLVGGSDCASAESNNGGCGQQATSLSNTYGTGFNSNGGGVYAMLWDESGVAVYFFPRQSIPKDITEMAPRPQTWATPFARWPATNCNPFQFFQQHSAIFDTTLCGDWAGNVWSTAGPPGQEQSCAERTGFPNCTAFVQNSGSSFAQAYWEVRSVRLYQKHVGSPLDMDVL